MSSLPRKGRWKPKPKAADPLAPIISVLAQVTIEQWLDEQQADTHQEDSDNDRRHPL